MSDPIGHECGLALIRLRQPLTYFRDRYGDAAWGMRKLFLLMQKQHNRGQDGAGISLIKFDMPPGEPYLKRIRSDRHNAIERLFDVVMKDVNVLQRRNRAGTELSDQQLKKRCEFLGELLIGHLRYGTHSGNALSNCHPLVRKNNVSSRNLAIAGNFNMTNATELFDQLVDYGLNPVGESDTQVILERIGYFLDQEHIHLSASMGPGSFRGLEGRALARAVSEELDIGRILAKASEGWDGGYVFAGLLGNGDAFACRDPAGIRPGFFYIDEEVVAVASERAALTSVFDVEPEEVEPIRPGHVLAIKFNGRIEHEPFTDPIEMRQCTFERIYFSRGNDPSIYEGRKSLGRNLAPRLMKVLDNDIEHAVFSFIPNPAESAYLGLLEETERLGRRGNAENLAKRIASGEARPEDVESIANCRLRAEKIAHKDQRLRTFITHDEARRDLVAHIYDITRGVVKSDDTLVVLDDSSVRGTTLRESIITILSRLNPLRIFVLSSSPPIMYPDCYGIDMSRLGRFIAFEAAVALLKDRGEERLLDEVEQRCTEQADLPSERMTNHVGAIYERFTLDEIQEKVAQLVRPTNIPWTGEVRIMYQTVEGLLKAMPEHTGDWYFTGRYPTPGGYKVLNTSYLNWRSNSDDRAY